MLEKYVPFVRLIPMGLLAGASHAIPKRASGNCHAHFADGGFFNALSGTIGYARPKRIDYKIGVIFSLATMPGAVLGALATTAVSRERFDLLFGFLLLAIAIVLVISRGRRARPELRKAVIDRQALAV